MRADRYCGLGPWTQHGLRVGEERRVPKKTTRTDQKKLSSIFNNNNTNNGGRKSPAVLLARRLLTLRVQFHLMDSDLTIPVHKFFFVFLKHVLFQHIVFFSPTTASSSFPSILFFQTIRPAQKHQPRCTG